MDQAAVVRRDHPDDDARRDAKILERADIEAAPAVVFIGDDAEAMDVEPFRLQPAHPGIVPHWLGAGSSKPIAACSSQMSGSHSSMLSDASPCCLVRRRWRPSAIRRLASRSSFAVIRKRDLGSLFMFKPFLLGPGRGRQARDVHSFLDEPIQHPVAGVVRALPHRLLYANRAPC
jgi:hypothetical protein